jgi:hypothetical protein
MAWYSRRSMTAASRIDRRSLASGLTAARTAALVARDVRMRVQNSQGLAEGVPVCNR